MVIFSWTAMFHTMPLHILNTIIWSAKTGLSIANENSYQVQEHNHKTSSISRTKSQSLNGSCILLQLSSLNPLKPGVKLRMKM